MGLTSALSTALTGLQASETTISVVGNNIANSNTVGFKESDVLFSTQFLQTLSIGSAPNDSLGGTNPQQLGLGVQVAAVSPNFAQGTIEISSNPLDIAIQGDGFLIVQDSQGGDLYTRNGQLQLNANNELVTSSGQRVIGYTADDTFTIDESQLVPISIPIGEEQVAQATTQAVLNGVLNPAVTLGTQPEEITSEVLIDGSFVPPDISLLDEFAVETSQAPVIPPNASTDITFGAAGTGPDTGQYEYRLVPVDINGLEGTFSAAFGVDASASGGGSITLGAVENLPNVPANFETFNVYRSLQGASDFRLVGATGTDPDTFVDTTSTADFATAAALDESTIDSGSFSYQITFVDTNGAETRPALLPGSEALGSGGGRIRLDLSGLQLPDTSADNIIYENIRIYRNLGGEQNNFRQLTEITIPPDFAAPPLTFVDSTDSSELLTAPELNLDGQTVSDGTSLVDIQLRDGSTVTNPFEVGQLNFAGSRAGATLDEQTFQITEDSTVQELLNFLTDALGITETSQSGAPLPDGQFPGVQLNANGQIVVTSNLGEQNALDIGLSAFQIQPEGSNVTSSPSVVFSQTQNAVGPGTNTEFLVFDSLGVPINVQITTVLEERDGNSTTYRWFANSPDNEPGVEGNTTTVVGDGVLVFDQQGNLLPGADTSISITRNDTASESPLEIDLDFDAVRSLAAVNALNEPTSSLNVSSQDGFPPGVLTDFIITESGLIQGQFSNGVQRDLGQLLLARFANPQGLTQVGNSLFQTGVNSGDPIIDEPGANGNGTLTAGAVELSNTDIGQNLIELILASTQYRGGSRVITATQELLDELLALQR